MPFKIFKSTYIQGAQHPLFHTEVICQAYIELKVGLDRPFAKRGGWENRRALVLDSVFYTHPHE